MTLKTHIKTVKPEERELARKREEQATLEVELAERELRSANLRAELGAFERRYLHFVGVRYAELDELKAQIAERLANDDDPDLWHLAIALALMAFVPLLAVGMVKSEKLCVVGLYSPIWVPFPAVNQRLPAGSDVIASIRRRSGANEASRVAPSA